MKNDLTNKIFRMRGPEDESCFGWSRFIIILRNMQEARTIFAGVPSMGDEPKVKVSHY